MMFFPNKLLPARKRQEEPAPTPPQRRGEQKGAKGFLCHSASDMRIQKYNLFHKPCHHFSLFSALQVAI